MSTASLDECTFKGWNKYQCADSAQPLTGAQCMEMVLGTQAGTETTESKAAKVAMKEHKKCLKDGSVKHLLL